MEVMELLLTGLSRLTESFLETYFQPLLNSTVTINPTPPAQIQNFRPSKLQLQLYQSLGDNAQTVANIFADWSPRSAMQLIKQALFLFIECELAHLEHDEQWN